MILVFLVPSFSHFVCVCFLGIASGVKNVGVDLSNQVVQILGSSPVKAMADALEQTGRKARLIGRGVPEGWLPFSFSGQNKPFGFAALSFLWF